MAAVALLAAPALAGNICNETVPSDRNVDGIPAYAQCSGSTSGDVFSNNGIDTATSSQGSDWVQTQWTAGYQCTEFAFRYLRFKWNISEEPNGNAGSWCDGTPPSGLEKKTTPVHGDLLVLAPGSCGAGADTGHVAVVDEVSGDSVVVVEQNMAHRGSYMTSCAKCFLHATANDGTVHDGGVPRDMAAAPDMAGPTRDLASPPDFALPAADFASPGPPGSHDAGTPSSHDLGASKNAPATGGCSAAGRGAGPNAGALLLFLLAGAALGRARYRRPA